jgi:hypothetical protein
LNRTAQLLRLISGYAASAILCEALAPAVFLTSIMDFIMFKTSRRYAAGSSTLSPALERSAQQLLVGKGAVVLRRIEEVTSQFDGTMQCGNRLSFIRRTVN